MEAINSIEYKGMTIQICYDLNAESPREWDNVGTIYSNHRDYNPDGHKIDEIENEEGELVSEELDRRFIWLPVYYYEHSGLSVSTKRDYPYNDGWDSGLFGIIAVEKAMVRNDWGWKAITEERREQILRSLEGEIEIFDSYCRGEVYGFVVEDEEGEEIDACGGYYGDDGIEHAILEAKGIVDYELERRKREERIAMMDALKKHIAKRKGQIKAHAPLYARAAFKF